jgi:hypothetical protein
MADCQDFVGRIAAHVPRWEQSGGDQGLGRPWWEENHDALSALINTTLQFTTNNVDMSSPFKVRDNQWSHHLDVGGEIVVRRLCSTGLHQGEENLGASA